MAKKSSQTPISNTKRDERLRDARLDLDQFVSAMHPLLRKIIVQKDFTIAEWLAYYHDPDLQKSWAAALIGYQQRLVQIPSDWKRYKRGRIPEEIALIEWQHLGHRRGAGAPKKSVDEREDTLIEGRCEEAERRLKPGWELRCRLKARGGFASGDEQVGIELLKNGYSAEDVAAILKAKSSRGAAEYVVVWATGKTKHSVTVAVTRVRSRRKTLPENSQQ